MGKVIGGMTMSLDGFVNDRNGSVGALYPDLKELAEAEMLQEMMNAVGAVVMGRHAYDMAHGDFTGYEYQVPIFVVTHAAPDKVAKGENNNLKFHFVPEGFESAVKQAKVAAGDKDVTLIGGANATQQCLKAGLLDELQVGVMPILLGDGLRLFDHFADSNVKLEKIKVIESPAGRTDILFRVLK